MTGDYAGGHSTVEQFATHFSEIGHFFIQSNQDTHLLEFGQPGNIAAGNIRQSIALRTDQYFVMQFSPFVRDSVHFDSGILSFKSRNQDVHQGFVFSGLSAVMVPEIDRYSFAFSESGTNGQEHQTS